MGVGYRHHAPTVLTPGKRPVIHCTGDSRLQDRSERVRKTQPTLEFYPRTVYLVASRYSDYTIPNQKYRLLSFS